MKFITLKYIATYYFRYVIAILFKKYFMNNEIIKANILLKIIKHSRVKQIFSRNKLFI